jgi:hypothetical protein
MGSLRLPEKTVRALRSAARASGLPLAEVLRRKLRAALDDAARLAAVSEAIEPGHIVRLGALPMPANLAQRLTLVAQELGISVAEVVRRATG